MGISHSAARIVPQLKKFQPHRKSTTPAIQFIEYKPGQYPHFKLSHYLLSDSTIAFTPQSRNTHSR